MKSLALLIISAAAFFFLAARDARAQRDYFTPEEIEMIRDTQQLDNRTMLLTKIIDRRFAALKNDVGGEPISPKEVEKWGTLPSASRRDLLWDIRRVLEKAIADIDNLAERPKSMVIDPDNKKPKKFDDVFPDAVRILAKAAARYQSALKAELDKATEPAENGSILASLEMCAEIIAAQAKLPSLSKN